MGATYGALLGSLSSNLSVGPLQAAMALGFALKTSACIVLEPPSVPPSPMVRAGQGWPHPGCLGLDCGNRPVVLEHLGVCFRPQRKIGEEAARETGSGECQSCSRCIQWLQGLPWRWRLMWWRHLSPCIERVSRFPPLYPAGNSDINSPLKIEFLTCFNDKK